MRQPDAERQTQRHQGQQAPGQALGEAAQFALQPATRQGNGLANAIGADPQAGFAAAKRERADFNARAETRAGAGLMPEHQRAGALRLGQQGVIGGLLRVQLAAVDHDADGWPLPAGGGLTVQLHLLDALAQHPHHALAGLAGALGHGQLEPVGEAVQTVAAQRGKAGEDGGEDQGKTQAQGHGGATGKAASARVQASGVPGCAPQRPIASGGWPRPALPRVDQVHAGRRSALPCRRRMHWRQHGMPPYRSGLA
jgi:hypothetical protein